jgi:hypothetical protein
MNVSELIELLKTMPKDSEVVIHPIDFVQCDIEEVGLWNGVVYISDIKTKG